MVDDISKIVTAISVAIISLGGLVTLIIRVIKRIAIEAQRGTLVMTDYGGGSSGDRYDDGGGSSGDRYDDGTDPPNIVRDVLKSKSASCPFLMGHHKGLFHDRQKPTPTQLALDVVGLLANHIAVPLGSDNSAVPAIESGSPCNPEDSQTQITEEKCTSGRLTTDIEDVETACSIVSTLPDKVGDTQSTGLETPSKGVALSKSGSELPKCGTSDAAAHKGQSTNGKNRTIQKRGSDALINKVGDTQSTELDSPYKGVALSKSGSDLPKCGRPDAAAHKGQSTNGKNRTIQKRGSDPPIN